MKEKLAVATLILLSICVLVALVSYFLNGAGIRRDNGEDLSSGYFQNDEARRSLIDAAGRGDSDAALKLYYHYTFGEPNPTLKCYFLYRAFYLGNVHAKFVAAKHLVSDGTTTSRTEAEKIFRELAASGHELSKKELEKPEYGTRKPDQDSISEDSKDRM